MAYPIRVYLMEEPVTGPGRFKTVARLALIAIAVIVVLVFIFGLTSQPNTNRESPSWTLVSYRDATGILIPVINNGDITARFGRDGNVTGFSGCNKYLSAYIENSGNIRITYPLHSTLTCPDAGVMQQESTYYDNLVKSFTVKAGPSEMTVFDVQGKTLLVFRKS